MRAWAVFVSVSAVLAGCFAPTPASNGPASNGSSTIDDKTGGSGSQAPTTPLVGPEGGVVRSADGLLLLTVPEGALAAPTPITIQTTAPGGAVEGTVALGSYEFLPSGLVFAIPARLEARVPAIEGVDELPLIAPALSDAAGTSVVGNVTIQREESGYLVSGDVRHFSKISFLWYHLTAIVEPDSIVRGVGQRFWTDLRVITGSRIPETMTREVYMAKFRTVTYHERILAPVESLRFEEFGGVASGLLGEYREANNLYRCASVGKGFLEYVIDAREAFPERLLTTFTSERHVTFRIPVECRERTEPSPTTIFVGADGGTYTLAGGDGTAVEVRVPFGAFRDEVPIEVETALGGAGQGLSLGPTGGPVALDAPITVEITTALGVGQGLPVVSVQAPSGSQSVSPVEEVRLEDGTTIARQRVELTELGPAWMNGWGGDARASLVLNPEAFRHAVRSKIEVALVISDIVSDVSWFTFRDPHAEIFVSGPLAIVKLMDPFGDRSLGNSEGGKFQMTREATGTIECLAPGRGRVTTQLSYSASQPSGGNTWGSPPRPILLAREVECFVPEGATLIDTAGGSATSTDGKLLLVLPEGALTRPTPVHIIPSTAGYVFHPAELTLEKPAEVRMVVDPEASTLPLPEGAGVDPEGTADFSEEAQQRFVEFTIEKFGALNFVSSGVSVTIGPVALEHGVDAPFDHTTRVVVFPDAPVAPEGRVDTFASRAGSLTELDFPSGSVARPGASPAFGAPSDVSAGGISALESTANVQYRCTFPGPGAIHFRVTFLVSSASEGSLPRVAEVEVAADRSTTCVAPPAPPPPPATPGLKFGGVAFDRASEGIQVLPQNWGPFTSEAAIALVTLEDGWTAIDLGTGTALHTEAFGLKYYHRATGAIASDGTGFVVAASAFDWRLTPFSGEKFGATETTSSSASFFPFGPDGGLIRPNSNSLDPVMLRAEPDGTITRTAITSRLPGNRFLSSAFPLGPAGPLVAIARDPSDGNSATTERYFAWWVPGLDLSAGVKTAIDIGTSPGDVHCLNGLCLVSDYGTQKAVVFTFTPDGTLTLTNTRTGTIALRDAATSDGTTAFFGVHMSADSLPALVLDVAGGVVRDFTLGINPPCNGPRDLAVARNAGGPGWHVLVAVCDENDRIEVSRPFRVSQLEPGGDPFDPAPP